MISLGIFGGDGKIGKTLISYISNAEDITLGYAIVEDKSPVNGKDTGQDGVLFTSELPNKVDGKCNVFIDFSTPSATEKCLNLCVDNKIPLVIGTTGHNQDQQANIIKYAEKIAIMQSSNMSAAVNACFLLLEKATKMLGEDYDVEIIEKHHKHKIDAPSGTALEMGRRVASSRGNKLQDIVVYDRHAKVEAREQGSIGMQSIRGGDIVGEHEVLFINRDEIISLKHQAFSRGIFAAGAIRAARWLVGQGPGLYSMTDVLSG